MAVPRLAFPRLLLLSSLLACGVYGESAAVDSPPTHGGSPDSPPASSRPAAGETAASSPIVDRDELAAAGDPGSLHAPEEAAPDLRPRIVIVPLGEFPGDLLAAVEQALKSEYDAQVEVAAPVALPKTAWYSPRKRYRADLLIDDLHRFEPSGAGEVKILGLTSVDISTTKGKFVDWGVFGLGELGGSTCVVSIHRLKRKARDRDHLRFRSVSTAIHEVGHTFGLEHCGEERCVMQDAEGSISNTDGGTGHLAATCRAKFDERPGARSPPPPRGLTPG